MLLMLLLKSITRLSLLLHGLVMLCNDTCGGIKGPQFRMCSCSQETIFAATKLCWDMCNDTSYGVIGSSDMLIQLTNENSACSTWSKPHVVCSKVQLMSKSLGNQE